MHKILNLLKKLCIILFILFIYIYTCVCVCIFIFIHMCTQIYIFNTCEYIYMCVYVICSR